VRGNGLAASLVAPDTMHTPQPLGSRLAWVRDFVVVGAFASLAPGVLAWNVLSEFVVAAAIAGPLTGALLGLALRPLLLGPMSRVPFGALIVVGLVLGALWGAMVGGLASFGAHLGPRHEDMGFGFMLMLAVIFGAIAGALQLGWFFVPYTVQRARGRRAWPAVVAACLISPTLGIAALKIYDVIFG
jgi:hypothetical protein